MRLNRRSALYLVLAAAGVIYFLTPLRLGIVMGESMAPSLRSGEPYLLLRALFTRKPVQRGDVVVFTHGGVTYVKRVMATAGEALWVVRQRGAAEEELVMDWQLAKLRRVMGSPLGRAIKVIRRRVPPGTVYVVGDHLMASNDSRHYGFIQLDAIQGKVLFAPPAPPVLEHVAAGPSTASRS